MINVFKLKDEALDEAYVYFDKKIRSLPKDENVRVDRFAHGLVDNDVDAFRHAYVSAVFAKELGVGEAKFYGFLQEILGGNGSSTNNSDAAKNMDYWNNDVGRKYGKDFSKTRADLLKLIHDALKNDELIIDLNDFRKYGKDMSYVLDPQKPVIVLNENKTGRNELFCDLLSGNIFDRETFVNEIENGKYSGYTVASIDGMATPMSKPDGVTANNLG
jgi:hypothetical protein